MTRVSIIIPALNEQSCLKKQHNCFKSILKNDHEIILVDGGSTDGTLEIAQKLGIKTISVNPSRGHQLHSGAMASSNDVLIFLHADTQLPITATNDVITALDSIDKLWGRFNVTFTNSSNIFKVIAWFMNKRSCITAMVTGDHAIFIKRKILKYAKG